MKGTELDLIHFQWAVYKEGYRWMEHSEITAPELSEDEARLAGPALIIPDSARTHAPDRPWRAGKPLPPYVTDEARHYTLEPGMFMTFAQLEPSKDSILGFVRRYGHLGLDRHVGLESDGYRECPLRGEYFADWEVEIRSLKIAVQAWDLARKNLVADLKRHVLREKNSVELPVLMPKPDFAKMLAQVKDEQIAMLLAAHDIDLRRKRRVLRESDCVTDYDPCPGVPEPRPLWALRARIPDPSSEPDLAKMLTKPEDKQIALLFAQHAIDVRLREHCSLSLIADASYSELHLHAVPRNLVGAMWLQFAVAASGDSQFRKCKMCTTWFEVGPGGRRRQSLLCSDACKMRSLRSRVRTARQLKAEGKSDDEIASQLHAKVKTVMNWTRS